MMLILSARDGVADAPSSATGADGPAAVALVPDDPLRPQARTPAAWPLDRPLGQQPVEDGRLVRLARGEHHGQRLAPALALEVDLGAIAPLAAPERFRFRAPFFAPAACWCARITLPSTN